MYQVYPMVISIISILPSRGLHDSHISLHQPFLQPEKDRKSIEVKTCVLMVDVHLSFWKEPDQKKAGFPLHFQAPWRESLEVPTVSFVASPKLMYDAGKDLAVLLKPHVPVQKRDTEPRCAGELAKVRVVCNCAFACWFNMPWWLKDAESPLPQIKTQHLLEWTEFNRPEHWSNPWSQIDIVLNLNF